MTPRPIKVKVLDDYCLKITFQNGKTKIYDILKMIQKSFYSKLKNKHFFSTVKVKDITLEWATGEDICPDELYVINFNN